MRFAIALLALLVVSSANAAAGEDYARRLGDLVNAYRIEHGVKALAVDGTIASLAREHSSEMAKAKRMNHEGYQSRVRRSGLAMCLENVGWNYPTAQAQFEAWKKSSGHDRNMLDRRVARMGIGVVDDYVTFIACGV